MQPEMWKPPVELSKQEEQIVKKIRKAKLFVFLREHRHELLDEALQQELANLYRKAERGHPPIAPAMLALALILQAYMGISDDEVIEATVMDRRWQLVLDCLDTEQAPFSKGTLVAFRQRLIEAHMDRRLIERTIEIASQSQAFGPRALRAALDSSPLWGAGRVEDTYNLVGHARKPGPARGGRSAGAGAGRSGAKGAVGGWMDTNAMGSTAWIAASSARWGSRLPMPRKPVSPKRLARIWTGKGLV